MNFGRSSFLLSFNSRLNKKTDKSNLFISRYSSLHYGYNILRSVLALSTLTILLLNFEGIRDAYFNRNFPTSFIVDFDIYSLFSFSFSYFVSIVVLIITILGYFPSIMGLLHFYVTASFSTHFSIFCDGGDYLTALITFLFIPITLTDNRINSWKPFKETRFYNSFQRISIYINYNILKFLICIVYFHAATAKFHITEWYNGTAIYYFLSEPLSGNTFFVENYFFKALISNSFFIALITWGTLIIEVLIAFMLFSNNIKLKKIVFILGMVLHLLIIPTFNIPAFSFRMIACLFFYLIVQPTEREKITS
ncbi:MAG: hypothetical protein Q7W45_01900 [Bacteroidota bacterium]|nr:hypothetical protein [Bacteroidota bacterium]MDP3146588.1 hypothetical protein [Bacteroidota bacterium]